MWELLHDAKKDKTVILTTQYMDEADFLADRVAIMASGKLQCSGGTPLDLKRKFGVNYHLSVEKMKGCDITAIEILISQVENICSYISERPSHKGHCS